MNFWHLALAILALAVALWPLAMASAVATQTFLSRHKITGYHHAPNSTTADIITPDAGTTKRWIAMLGFKLFAFQYLQNIATTGATKVEIVVATDATGTDVVNVKDSGAIALNAIGKMASLECCAAEIAQLASTNGKRYTHIALRVTHGNAADKGTATYIFADSLFKFPDMTPATA